MRVVGVVANTKQKELNDWDSPYIYVPMLQFPAETITLHVRTTGDVASLSGTVRDVVASVDRGLSLYNVRTFADHARAATFRQRLAGSLLTVFGLLALVLATVGLYAVLSLLVGQRTREFGIRLALGATTGDLGKLVLREAGLLVGIGITLGIGGALLVGKALDDLLIGVKPNDSLTLVLVAVVLGTAALVACLAPARRAARLDPVKALRTE
jgi:ABC-type antimicrobial peptide transport system permease subunit